MLAELSDKPWRTISIHNKLSTINDWAHKKNLNDTKVNYFSETLKSKKIICYIFNIIKCF